MSSSLFVNAHTNFSCQISFCIFRYWENGQLFLKHLTRIAVHALLKNLSVNISKQRGKALKTHGLSWNAWKYLVPALWGRETFLCEQLFLSWPLLCQLGHCFFVLLLYSSFPSDPAKCWRKYYVLLVLLVWYDQELLNSWKICLFY